MNVRAFASRVALLMMIACATATRIAAPPTGYPKAGVITAHARTNIVIVFLVLVMQVVMPALMRIATATATRSAAATTELAGMGLSMPMVLKAHQSLVASSALDLHQLQMMMMIQHLHRK